MGRHLEKYEEIFMESYAVIVMGSHREIYMGTYMEIATGIHREIDMGRLTESRSKSVDLTCLKMVKLSPYCLYIALLDDSRVLLRIC